MERQKYYEIEHVKDCIERSLATVRTVFETENEALNYHNDCIQRGHTCRLLRVIKCALRTPRHIVIFNETDRWWLRFFHDRLVNVHGESPNIGYMHILRARPHARRTEWGRHQRPIRRGHQRKSD